MVESFWIENCDISIHFWICCPESLSDSISFSSDAWNCSKVSGSDSFLPRAAMRSKRISGGAMIAARVKFFAWPSSLISNGFLIEEMM